MLPLPATTRAAGPIWADHINNADGVKITNGQVGNGQIGFDWQLVSGDVSGSSSPQGAGPVDYDVKGSASGTKQ